MKSTPRANTWLIQPTVSTFVNGLAFSSGSGGGSSCWATQVHAEPPTGECLGMFGTNMDL